MGLKDLGQLFQKKNSTFLVLVIWLITGFSILYFARLTKLELLDFWARLIFLPLLVVCLVLFLYAALFRGDIRHASWKNIGKASGFFLIVLVVYIIVGAYIFAEMFDYFTSIMFVVSIFSYILITAIFSMYYCFEQGVKLDDKVYKAPTAIAFIVRWGLFFMGILISCFLLLYAPSILARQAPLNPKGDMNPALALMLYWMPIITIIMILAFAFVAIVIIIIRGRFNAWLGVFFVFIGGYVTFLMISALFTVEEGTSLPIIIARLVMFGFDMFLLLVTIGSLIGKRAELIGEKLKVINSDAILIWLIFAKAAFEYSDILLTPGELTVMKGVTVFYLLIPLMIIMALVGIIKYGAMKKARKRVKVKKKRIKTSKKQVEKVRKAREKAEIKAEKVREKAETKAEKAREKAAKKAAKEKSKTK